MYNRTNVQLLQFVQFWQLVMLEQLRLFLFSVPRMLELPGLALALLALSSELELELTFVATEGSEPGVDVDTMGDAMLCA